MTVSRTAPGTLRSWALAALLICGEAAAERQEIVIAATHWDPFTSTSIEGGGLLIEIAVEALARAGVQARVEFMPWKRALVFTREGKYDALAGASFTPEREAQFHYPRYHFLSRLVLFTQRDRLRAYEKLVDLCPASVGVLSGSFIIDRLQETPCLDLELSDDVVTNLRKLAVRRIDFVAESEASVYHYLQKTMPQHADSIAALEPPLLDDPVYVVFSRKLADYRRVSNAYDEGVDSMRSDGTLAGILSKYGLAGEP